MLEFIEVRPTSQGRSGTGERTVMFNVARVPVPSGRSGVRPRFAWMVFAVSLAWISSSLADDPHASPRREHGLQRRAPWTTSRLTGSPEPPPPYRAVPAFPKLKFGPLVDLAAVPGTD